MAKSQGEKGEQKPGTGGTPAPAWESINYSEGGQKGVATVVVIHPPSVHCASTTTQGKQGVTMSDEHETWLWAKAASTT